MYYVKYMDDWLKGWLGNNHDGGVFSVYTNWCGVYNT